jgi:hypothetical protein
MSSDEDSYSDDDDYESKKDPIEHENKEMDNIKPLGTSTGVYSVDSIIQPNQNSVKKPIVSTSLNQLPRPSMLNYPLRPTGYSRIKPPALIIPQAKTHIKTLPVSSKSLIKPLKITSDQIMLDLVKEILTPLSEMDPGYSSKITKYECPYCHTTNSIFTSKTFTNFIVCSNKYCPLVYIPRNRSLYAELKSIINSRWANRFYWIKYKIELDQSPKPMDYDMSEDYVECIGCTRQYLRFTVLHNDKFSVCPNCLFFNPYILTKEMKDFDDPTIEKNILKCNECKLHYDISEYTPPETVSIFGEAVDKNICATCALANPLLKDLIYQDYDDSGTNFVLKYPSIDTYLSVDFEYDHLFDWTLKYLPAI